MSAQYQELWQIATILDLLMPVANNYCTASPYAS